MSMLARSMAILIIALSMALLSGCATTPENPEAHSWYPGLDNPNLTEEQRRELIQMDNADWQMEQQREQEIWQRLTPQYIYQR